MAKTSQRTLRQAPCVALLLLLALAAPLRAAQAPSKPPVVIVTIGPIRDLVAGVMRGVGVPVGLIPPDQAPETFALHDKDVDALRQADVVFWIGPSLEAELARPMADLEIGARIVDLSDTAGLLLYPPRHGGEWDAPPPSRRPPGESGGPVGADGHLWLDADNVRLLIGRIAMVLTDVDFGNAETYRMNAERLRKDIDRLDQAIAQSMASVHGRPYLLLHDDFQYWEVRYGLEGLGSIAVDSDPQAPVSMAEVAAKLDRLKAGCVIGDSPADEPALRQIAAATKARTARLDLYDVDESNGGKGFLEMMRRTSDGFSRCLGGQTAFSPSP
jgi:zinc transport system substrate-binding protein